MSTTSPTPPPAQPDPRVIRISPGRATGLRIFALGLVVVNGAGPLVTIALHPTIAIVIAAGFYLLVTLFVATWLIRYAKHSRFEFGDGKYTVFGAYGHKTFTVNDIGTIVTVTAMSRNNPRYGLGPSTQPQLFVFNKAGRRILRIESYGLWTVAQLAELAEDMISRGAHCDAIPEQVTSAQVRARYPKSMSWIEGLTPTGLLEFVIISSVVGTFVIIGVILIGCFIILWITDPAAFAPPPPTY